MSKQENSKSYFLTKTIFTKNESKELSAFGTGTFSKEIVQRFFTGEKTRYTSFILRTVQYRPKKRLIFIWLSSATQWSLLSQSFKIWSRDQELSSEVFIIMMTSSVTSQLKPQGYEGFQTFFGISAYARPPTTLKVVPKWSSDHSASFDIWHGKNVDFPPKNSRSGQYWLKLYGLFISNPFFKDRIFSAFFSIWLIFHELAKGPYIFNY